MERIAVAARAQAGAGAGARRAVAAQGRDERHAAIIGRSPPMLRLFDRVETIAQSDAPVLITGESGTGKELVARTLHERSTRAAEAVHRRELRGVPGDAAGGRAVRSRARRVHRRGQAPRRPLQGGRRRARCCSTRSPRCRCRRRPSSCACCRKGRSSRSGTNEVDAGRRPDHLGDAPQPARADPGGDVPRGPVLPAQRARHRDPAAARAARGPAAFATVLLEQIHARRASRRRRSRRAPGRCCRSTHFPGNVREFAHAIEHAVVLAGGGEIDVEHLPAGITGDDRRRAPARRAATCARWPPR